MGAYQYVAVDPGGKEHRGVLEGDTPRHVRQLLRDRQLLPVEVAEVEARERKAQRHFSLFSGISGLDLAMLTRQLATLVKAGLPLEEALLAVSEHTEKPRLKSIVLGVRAKVLEGHSLAAGLDEFPYAFPPVYRATVMAGEQAGQLDSVLERLADYTESRHGLRQKVAQAMVYPILLTAIALIIMIVMLIVVVPKVVGVFETTGQELPVMTRALIAISNLVQNWWFLLVGGVIAAIVIAVRLLRARAHPPARAWLAAAHPDLRPRDARPQHRTFHAHAQHPHRERRARPGGTADQRLGRSRICRCAPPSKTLRCACAKVVRSVAR